MRLTDEQRSDVERSLGLRDAFVWRNLRWARRHGIPEGELYDAATLGICKACAGSYDPIRGTFGTFAWKCMFNECRREGRRRTSCKRIPNRLFNTNVNVNRLPDPRHVDVTVNPCDLVTILGGLSKAHREVLTLRYIKGMTLNEIGQLKGVTRQAIDLRETAALKNCRRILDGIPAPKRYGGKS